MQNGVLLPFFGQVLILNGFKLFRMNTSMPPVSDAPKFVHVGVDGHRARTELAAIVPRSYCTREIGARQEELA